MIKIEELSKFIDRYKLLEDKLNASISDKEEYIKISKEYKQRAKEINKKLKDTANPDDHLIEQHKNINDNFVKFFLIIGLLGSFTTFSAFSFEVVNLIISKKILIAFIYISISIFVCILFAYLGMLVNKL